jgi:hypothetical protein
MFVRAGIVRWILMGALAPVFVTPHPIHPPHSMPLSVIVSICEMLRYRRNRSKDTSKKKAKKYNLMKTI